MTYLNMQHLPLAALGGWVCIPAQEVVVRLYVKKSNQKLIFFQTREQREIESNWILLLTDDGSLEGVCVLRRPVERVQMAEADGDALAGDQLSQVQLSKNFKLREATTFFECGILYLSDPLEQHGRGVPEPQPDLLYECLVERDLPVPRVDELPEDVLVEVGERRVDLPGDEDASPGLQGRAAGEVAVQGVEARGAEAGQEVGELAARAHT